MECVGACLALDGRAQMHQSAVLAVARCGWRGSGVSAGGARGAGLRRRQVRGSDVGVFIGIENTGGAHGGALLQGESVASSVYAVSGGTISIAAGRVSFALGRPGPCVSVDTACSAAVAASLSSKRLT